MNYYRFQSGRGRSQAFGLIKQRTNEYAGSAMNYKRMDLFEEILKIAEHLPREFVWDSVTLNQNYETAPHKDKGNRGQSVIVAFGDYADGELVVEGLFHDEPTESVREPQSPCVVDIKNKPLFFDGCKHMHWTRPFTGNRYSLVFYKVDRDFLEIPQWGFHREGKKMYLSETLGGKTIWYDKNGEKIFDETEEYSCKKQRSPTLRILQEQNLHRTPQ